MPDRALYYPEWGINDPLFLAEALLYFNRIGCIVPDEDFRPRPWHQDPEVNAVLMEAHEQFVSPVVPTDEQKKRAHERIKIFAELDPPEWCHPENLHPHQKQFFSAYKFASETVELLREKGWSASYSQPNKHDLQLIADAAADLVLGALVQECSSETMPPITDEPDLFSANCNLLLTELGTTQGLTLQQRGIIQGQADAQSDRSLLLMKIPHLALDRNSFQIDMVRQLLTARQDPEIDGQRQAFRNKVDDYLKQIRTAEPPELSLIAEEFQNEIDSDLRILNRELRRAGVQTLTSKEGIVAVVGGALTGTLNPGLGIAVGLTGGLLIYQQKRREVMAKHWSSWVFSLEHPQFSIW